MYNSKSYFFKLWTALFLTSISFVVQAQKIQSPQANGIGRTATLNEIKAWDIDVRPDFKGLPKGFGTVAQGEKIWEAQCASCHGTFGESNSIFFQLIGNTNKHDVIRGNVAALQLDSGAPARTMIMKLSSISTLWDYINRAMPWTAPKSLQTDEVYAVTAFLMNLAQIVPDEFVLSDKNIADVQTHLPNRNGMTTKHAMWPGAELGSVNGLIAKPDTNGAFCIKNCAAKSKISSSIPAYAMTAHGNLAEQNRQWGSIVGLDTSQAIRQEDAPLVTPKANQDKTTADLNTANIMPILQKNTCLACHGVDGKIVGPAFKEIAKRYVNRSDAASYLAKKIRSGGSDVWGSIPMPPMNIGEADAIKIARWLTQEKNLQK